MRFAFSRDQILFRDAARDIFQRCCPPTAVRAAWSTSDGRVPGLWSTLAEAGITGISIPEDCGGSGLNELDLVLVLEEAGRAASPEPLLETTAVAAPLIRDIAPAALGQPWLSRVASGEAIIAVGLAGDPYVSHAAHADLLLLQRGDELYAIPPGEASTTPQPSIDGSRRLASVTFTPTKSACFARGEGAKRAAALAFDRGALAAAAELLGIARRMLDMTVEYTKVRRQFGQPVGSFQAVKHHLASALVGLELARPLVYRAAYSIARGDEAASIHVSMAKAHASDAARGAARAALQCHGAIGYSVEHDLHLWLKRAWALAASWGDAAFHRARVGAVILDAGGI